MRSPKNVANTSRMTITAIFIVIASVLTVSARLAGTDTSIKAGDKKFVQSLFAEALSEYEIVLKGQGLKEDVRIHATWRAAQAEFRLGRIEGALARVEAATKLPGSSGLKFELLRVELLEEVVSRYGSLLQLPPLKEGAQTPAKTVVEMREEWQRAIEKLTAHSSDLASVPIQKIADVVELKGVDRELMPSLYDFLLDRLFSQIQSGTSPVRQKAVRTLTAALAKQSDLVGAAGRPVAFDMARIIAVMSLAHNPPPPNKKQPSPQPRHESINILRGLEVRTERGKARVALETAKLFRLQGNLAEAVATCKPFQTSSHASPETRACDHLVIELTAPSLEVSSVPSLPPGDHALHIRSRSLKEFHLRSFRLTESDLKTTDTGRGTRWTYISNEKIKSLLQRKPLREWSLTAQPSKQDFEFLKFETSAHTKEPGLYAVIISSSPGFEAGASMTRAVLVNVSEIAVFASVGLGVPKEQLFAPGDKPQDVNLKPGVFTTIQMGSGKPAPGATLDIRWRDNNTAGSSRLTSDSDGRTIWPYLLRGGNSYAYLSIDPVAKLGESTAFLWREASGSFTRPDALQIAVDVDRPVYRPGHSLQGRATLFFPTADGLRAVAEGTEVSIQGNDSSGNSFFQSKGRASAFGSVSFSTTLPKDRPLGNWAVTVSSKVRERDYAGAAAFRVEEYKLPEIEITLGKVNTLLKLNTKFDQTGSLKYLSGGAVGESQIDWQLIRQPWFPEFRWFHSWRGLSQTAGRSETVSQGTLKTNKNGTFSISFVPELDDESEEGGGPFNQFRLEILAHGKGSTVIQTSKTYSTGKQLFGISTPDLPRLSTPDHPIELTPKLVSLEGTPIEGSVSITVHCMSNPSVEKPEDDDLDININREDAAAVWEQAFENTSESATCGGMGKDKKFKNQYTADSDLASGFYKIHIAATVAGSLVEEDRYFVHLKRDQDAKALGHPRLSACAPLNPIEGDQVTCIFGSSSRKGPAFWEFWSDAQARSMNYEKTPGLVVVHLSTQGLGDQPGILRWFAAGDGNLSTDEIRFEIKPRNRSIAVDISAPQKTKPGADVDIKVHGKDEAGKSIDGEGLLVVRDHGLAILAGTAGHWSNSIGDGYNPYMDYLRTSSFSIRGQEAELTSGPIFELLRRQWADANESIIPRLVGYGRYSSGRGRYGELAVSRGFSGAIDKDMAASPTAAMSAIESAPVAKKAGETIAASAGQGSRKDSLANEIRSNFAATALFIPQFLTKGGEFSTRFKLPEQLTRWDVGALIVDKNGRARWSEVDFEANRDVSARILPPRFAREGDRFTATVVIQINQPQKSSCTVHFTATGIDVANAAASKELLSEKKSFSCKETGDVTLGFPVEAPLGFGALQFVARVETPSDSDAETITIPLLPAKTEHIFASTTVLNDTVDRKIGLSPLQGAPKPKDVIPEKLLVHGEPQGISEVLEAMPYWQEPLFESADSLAQQWTSLVLLSDLYQKYPDIKSLAQRIIKEGPSTKDAWKQEVELVSSAERPWMKNDGLDARNTRLISPDEIKSRMVGVVARLSALHSSEGGFAWLPGGKDDFFISLAVGEEISEAVALGIAPPTSLIRGLTSYIFRKMAKVQKIDQGSLTIRMLAAYVIASLNQNLDPAERNTLRKWTRLAEKNAGFLTPLGNAYLALTLSHLKDTTGATQAVRRAKQGLQRDPIVGSFWTAERFAWAWYSDSLFKHIKITTAIQAVNPRDPDLPGLQQWMLMNKKTSKWCNPRTATAALTLLSKRFLNEAGGTKTENSATTLKLAIGKTKEEVTFKQGSDRIEPLNLLLSAKDLSEIGAAPAVAASQKGRGTSFVSVVLRYAGGDTEGTTTPSKSIMQLHRRYFKVGVAAGGATQPVELALGAKVKKGDRIRTVLTLRSKTNLEYVQIKDPKPAGFEAVEQLSGWTWGAVALFREPRDTLTNIYLPFVPTGEVSVSLDHIAATAGVFTAAPAVVQSNLSPDLVHETGLWPWTILGTP